MYFFHLIKEHSSKASTKRAFKVNKITTQSCSLDQRMTLAEVSFDYIFRLFCSYRQQVTVQIYVVISLEKLLSQMGHL